MKITAACCVGMLLSVLACQTAAAAVVLEGTRIVHDAGKGRDVTLKAVNSGERVALTQAWIDAGDSHARPEDVRTPFRITPSAPRLLQPQEGQAWRITYAPRPSDAPLPQDRESLFYFNLLDIPPKPTDAQRGNLLQFAVRTRIKLFHRPAGLKGRAEEAPATLTWALHGREIRIANPSAYHVNLSTLTLPDGTALDLDMVPPGAHRAVPLPAEAVIPAVLTYTWLDDYGATRSGNAAIDGTLSPAADASARSSSGTEQADAD